MYNTACHKIASLQAISSGQEIPALIEAKHSLEYQFAQAAKLAEDLDIQVLTASNLYHLNLCDQLRAVIILFILNKIL